MTSNTNTNLIYFTIGFDAGFSNLLTLCIESIKRYNPNPTFDIVIMCDQNYIENIKHLKDTNQNNLNIQIYLTEQNNTPQECSMRKLEVFNVVPNIMNYSKVLFLDCDIIINGSLNELFDQQLIENKLYIFEENFKDPHTSEYFSHYDYTPDQLNFFNEHNILGFNTGQFMFVATNSMKEHFETIIQHTRNHKGAFYYEQSFMNVYFNLRPELRDSTLLKKYVTLYPDHTKYIPTVVIVHFNGDGSVGGSVKLSKMKHYFELK
jgi:lipopolysaccharide biosynthesis glycosyltransferase